MSDKTLTVASKLVKEYNVNEHVKMLRSFSGNQPGDPKKLANVLYEISRLPNPPVHLPLGTDSYQSIIEQRKKEAIELEQWKDLSFSTDYNNS